MARRSISYFAEERGRNKNPNFYINARDEDLRRNVKRIIRDIKNRWKICKWVLWYYAFKFKVNFRICFE